MTSPPYNLEKQYLGTGPEADHLTGVDSLFVSNDELKILKKLRAKIIDHAKANKRKQLYYEAAQVVDHLEIAVPRHLHDIGTAVGWAGTVVDALDERVNWLGWVTDEGMIPQLAEVFADNDLSVESNFGHLDGFVTGTGLVTVGVEDTDLLGRKTSSMRTIVSVESSSTASLLWDYRLRKSTAGLSQTTDDDGKVIMETLYLPNANLIFAHEEGSTQLKLIKRNDHDIGRCFMTRLPCRARPYQRDGRSEISRAVRYYTDAAVRTMLGMEVNREFYTAPQRYVLNAYPSDFGIKDGMSDAEKAQKGLSVAMGMINIIPPRSDNDEGDPPAVVEMRPAPPTPYIEQVKAYSIQMSAETGLPATAFGFVTDNPTSGDAIVKSDFRLTRRADRRIGGFAMGWKEVGLLAMLSQSRDPDIDLIRRMRCKFASPLMPTPAATADEMQKMLASGVLVPDSDVTYELYGRMDDRQIETMKRDKQAYEAKMMRKAMQEQAMAAAAAARTQAATGAQQKPADA